jgi:hypothetical protein
MSINHLLNAERQLRNGWWILIFFLVLASILMPALLFAQQNSMDVSIGLQAVIIVLASWICQGLRRKPLTELLGEFNLRWFKKFCLGGWVDWQWNPTGFSTRMSIGLVFLVLLFIS